MSDEPVTKNDWNTKPGKKAIFRGVMEHFKTCPGDIDECVNNPQTAIDIVTKYGNTDIPPGAKVVFLPRGDNLKGDATSATDLRADAAIVPPFVGMHYNAGSSLIITIPPADASDDAALKYACSYQIWVN
jgi:hypothetical protein